MGERVEHEPATALLSMPLRQSVAVVMERTPLASRWQSERWEAKGVVPDIFGKDAPPRTLYDDGKRLEVLFPGFAIDLKGEDLDGYFLNLTPPQPKVFVLVRSGCSCLP